MTVMIAACLRALARVSNVDLEIMYYHNKFEFGFIIYNRLLTLSNICIILQSYAWEPESSP
jgi:hypothetical protein